MNNKIWVVTYYDIAYGERQPTIKCFNNRENALKYYEYICSVHDVISIDECEIYDEFRIFE